MWKTTTASLGMVRGTLIARVSDGLPLAQSSEDQNSSQLAECTAQAKLVVRRLGPGSAPRCSIESGPMTLHYLVHPPAPDPSAVVYVAICEKSYPRKLAFAYLDELAAEFGQSHGAQVAQRTLRPYAFVAFDTFIQRTTRLYADARTAQSVKSSNLDRLNEDLADVTRIMTKNMEDLLWRGDSLDQMSTMSSSLRDESLRYRKSARKINIDAMIRKWAPCVLFRLDPGPGADQCFLSEWALLAFSSCSLCTSNFSERLGACVLALTFVTGYLIPSGYVLGRQTTCNRQTTCHSSGQRPLPVRDST